MPYFKFSPEKMCYYILFPEIQRLRTTSYKGGLEIDSPKGVSSTAVHIITWKQSLQIFSGK